MVSISRRWNYFWIGFTMGIVLPLATFLLIYLIFYSKAHFVKFIESAIVTQALPKILSLCAIPNLAVFYFFLNKEFWYTTRGVIASTLLCTVIVVFIKFVL